MGKDLASRTQCMRSRDAKVLSYLPSLLALMPTLHSMLALWCSSRSLLAACNSGKVSHQHVATQKQQNHSWQT